MAPTVSTRMKGQDLPNPDRMAGIEQTMWPRGQVRGGHCGGEGEVAPTWCHISTDIGHGGKATHMVEIEMGRIGQLGASERGSAANLAGQRWARNLM
ncbi:hypothetical protein E2562_024535, partial [Oryza meyeriana var. granulata]